VQIRHLRLACFLDWHCPYCWKLSLNTWNEYVQIVEHEWPCIPEIALVLTIETHPERIVAVIVTHFPDAESQTRLLHRLATQVNEIVIVSNSAVIEQSASTEHAKPQDHSTSEHTSAGDDYSSSQAELPHPAIQTHYLNNGNHHGLAGGLNLGITYALDILKTDYLYLSDQDSLPAPELVQRLLEHYKQLSSVAFEPIGAIGPSHQYINTRFDGFPRHKPVKVSDIISSGSLISCNVINAVGIMDEKLFIDYVDTEWCYRATSLGYSHWVVPGEQLEHTLGNASVRVLNTTKPIHHNADRHYYIVRNSMYLWRQPHMPLRWKLIDMAKFARRIIAYPLLSTDKPKHLRAVLQGIRDGFKMRMGER